MTSNRAPAAARWIGRPLALAPTRLPGLLALDFDEARLGAAPAVAPYAITESGIAVVPVLGPLVARGDWLSALFGAVAYDDLVSAVAAALDDPAVRGVVFEIDSPGGEVAGLFDAVEAIKALSKAAGKHLHAVASEAALSAAYAIACAAERITVTQTAEVGSVGVLALHVDASAANAKAGLAFTYLFAGDRKVDGNPHQPLSDYARTDVQADLDRLYDGLVGLVGQARALPPEAVRSTEARVYRGALAVSAGLADAVGTMASAVADLAGALDRSAQRPARLLPPANPRTLAMSEPDPGRTEPAPAPEPATPIPAPIVPAPAVVATPSSPPPVVVTAAPDSAERLRAEYAEIADVAAQGARLGIAIDAADAMRRGVKPDALRQALLAELAAKAEASALVATAPAAAGGESPIVKRARERAAAER